MARVNIAPNRDNFRKWNSVSIFVAGGITGCDDWQKYVCDRLAFELPDNVVIDNPRRPGPMDPTHEPSAREQIIWEHEHLRYADIQIFWFPKGGPNPIALFELGKELAKSKACESTDATCIILGVHPENARALDIKIQTELMFPDKIIYDDLPTMINDLVEHFKG